MKFSIVILFILIGCNQKPQDDLNFSESVEIGADDEKVTYELIKKHVIEPFNCTLCHANWAGTEAGVLSRISAGNPNNSPLFRRLQDESMPMGGSGIGTERLDLVEKYILEFAR
jgi:hypothetical protein